MNDGGTLFTITVVLYFVSAGLYHVRLLIPGAKIARAARVVAVVGWLFHTAGIAQRSMLLGQAPYLELRGAAMTMAWVIVGLTVLIEWRHKSSILGVPAMPIAALTMVLADTLPMFGNAHPLLPALYRNPLTAHIGSIVTAFGCFALAFCAALLYMVQERRLKHKRKMSTRPGGMALTEIEELANSVTAFGFSMLTLGLLLGLAWAASGTWKGHWYLQPIVLTTVATWVVYAAYLYRRGILGSRGRSNMYYLIVGFSLAALTLFVIRTILPGQHGS